MHGGKRCIFSVYLGMECRHTVGLFLPGIKKKEWKTEREWETERVRCIYVPLATGNFLLDPEWRTGVWLPINLSREKIPVIVPKIRPFHITFVPRELLTLEKFNRIVYHFQFVFNLQNPFKLNKPNKFLTHHLVVNNPFFNIFPIIWHLSILCYY